MNIGIAVRPTGHILIKKHGPGGDVRWKSGFDNIVLDVGWNNLINNVDQTNRWAHVPKYLYLGSGTTEPAATDSGLESASGTLPGKLRSGTSIGGSSTTDRYASVNQTFVYGQGEAEGVWTELGLAYGSTYTEPYNRSLIRDDLGNPISLTILSDEFLTVYVELRMYFPDTGSITGQLDYNGQAIDWTATMNATPLTEPTAQWGRNFWYEGFPYVWVKVDDTRLDMTYLGNLSWETQQQVYSPGTSRTITGFTIGIGSYFPVISISFTPSISVPAEHQLTVEKSSVQWTRDTVPTV